MKQRSLNHPRRGRQQSRGLCLLEWSAETYFTFLLLAKVKSPAWQAPTPEGMFREVCPSHLGLQNLWRLKKCSHLKNPSPAAKWTHSSSSGCGHHFRVLMFEAGPHETPPFYINPSDSTSTSRMIFRYLWRKQSNPLPPSSPLPKTQSQTKIK